MHRTFSRELDQAFGNSIIETDPELKVQALAYKGKIAHHGDLWVAKETWEDVLRLSKATGNKAWEARAVKGSYCTPSCGHSLQITLRLMVSFWGRPPLELQADHFLVERRARTSTVWVWRLGAQRASMFSAFASKVIASAFRFIFRNT